MTAFPKSRSGIVMFTNSENGLSIANQIARIALGAGQPGVAWLERSKAI
jgi:hypothetical protein